MTSDVGTSREPPPFVLDQRVVNVWRCRVATHFHDRWGHTWLLERCAHAETAKVSHRQSVRDRLSFYALL
jgi:hypothetical protein